MQAGFNEATEWLYKQDKKTLGLFRNEIEAVLGPKNNQSKDELPDKELAIFNTRVNEFGFDPDMKQRALEKFKAIRSALFADSVNSVSSITFEELIKLEKLHGRLSKDLDPKLALKNLIVLLSHPKQEQLERILVELRVATYPQELIGNSYKEGPTVDNVVEALSNEPEAARMAFLQSRYLHRCFTPDEIEIIRNQITRFDEQA